MTEAYEDGVDSEEKQQVPPNSKNVVHNKDATKSDSLPSPKKEASELEQSETSNLDSVFQLFHSADGLDILLMVVGSIGSILHGLALPVFFLFYGKLVDGIGLGSGQASTLQHIATTNCLRLVYLGIMSFAASWASVTCWMYTSERQANKWRVSYFAAMLKQDVAFFDGTNSTGELVTSMTSDITMVQDAIGEKLGLHVDFLATFVGGFIIGFKQTWRVSLLTLAVLPIVVLCGGLLMYITINLTKKIQVLYASAGNVAEQAVAQVRTVYSFVGEERAVAAYSQALRKALPLSYKGGLVKGVAFGFTWASLIFSWALLLWYGGVLVRNHKTTGGNVITAMLCVVTGGFSLGRSLGNLGVLGSGKAAAHKILQVINRVPTINAQKTRGTELSSIKGLLEIKNICFAYPSRPDVPIFQNFSLTIPQGESLAIVGDSGSGKSTIVALIERFYDPSSGEILLDGHNISTLDLGWLRGQIGLVNQEPTLFATTIKENIILGKEGASVKEVEDAAKLANAHNFISQLPNGYETKVGERGVQLSGGEKQRVAIARAILKNPPILLLDEATSALDSNSEQTVQDALNEAKVGRTTVVIAHRLSTVQDVTMIAVLKKGQIVEMGSHNVLISKDGAYSELVRLQRMANDSSNVTNRLSVSKRVSSGSMDFSRGKGFNLEADHAAGAVKSDPKKPTQSALWRLFLLSRPDWMYGFFGVVGAVLAGVTNPLIAYFLGEVMAAFYNTDHHAMKTTIARVALVYVGLGVLCPLAYGAQHGFMEVMGENLIARVRELMFAAVLRNEVGWFDQDENNSSQLTARLENDATNVKAATSSRISVLVQNAAVLVSAFSLACIIQWRVALVVISTFPCLVLSTILQNLFFEGFAGDIANSHEQAARVTGDAVGSIRTVAAFSAEKRMLQLLEGTLAGPKARSFTKGMQSGLAFGFSQFVQFSAYALGLWYCARLVQQGIASVTSVMQTFTIITLSSYAVADTIAMFPDMMKGGQALRSVLEVIDRVTKIDADDKDAVVLCESRGGIVFKGVTFSYPSRPDRVIFTNLSFEVHQGTSLAIVGTSGSGKSSIISLIERFYDTDAGSIMVDGTDIRRYNLKSLRHHIALVQQEPSLFATTIYENILYGKQGASETEIIEAAKAANAHSFISALPDGYQTEVGERGTQLSGGQKQRVAIARAVLKNPAILLLDEATSALDSESESVVQEALDRLMVRRTTVLIAHRLSTVRNATSIAVLQDGIIVEKGSHEQLLSDTHGAYTKLTNLHR